MKKIYSCLIILTFFASCADNETLVQENNTATSKKGIGEILPFYTNNPYDNAGWLCVELFDAYYDGSSLPNDVPDVIERVETIASSNSSFTAINPSGYEPLSSARIAYLASQRETCISEVISASSMTLEAKVSLEGFITSITSLYDTENDASTMYLAVVNYENTVINNPLFTSNDKKIILITTSIARHISYRIKKRPKKNTDPDWIIFVGHVAASTEGAEEGDAKAIVQALVTGIVSNK